MRFIITILLAFASLQVNGQQVYSLAQCIEMAWENNLNVKQSTLSIESSESQLRSAKANVLPNLNGFATHNYNWGQRIDPFTNQFASTRVQSNSFGLSAGVNLFNGLQNYQNIRAQEASVQVSKMDLEAQKNDIALTVSGAYLQLLLTDELIVSAEQQVGITQRQLDRVVKMVKAGAANIGTQYELEAQLARDRSTLTQRQNDKLLAQLQLKQLMLIPADESIEVEKPQIDVDNELVLENTSTVYGYAEGAMPEIKRAEYSLVRWERQLGNAKSGWYPSLILSGSIGSGYSGLRTEVTDLVPFSQSIGFTESGEEVFAEVFEAQMQRVPFITQVDDNFNQFVGLSLNVPIFNRYQVKNNVDQAKINRSIAEIQVEQEKLGLRQRIESARTDAIAAREQYKANQEALKSAQKAFDFAEARFEAGAINSMEFNNAKNNLMIAEAQVSQARYDFIFRTKILDFYMGKALSL